MTVCDFGIYSPCSELFLDKHFVEQGIRSLDLFDREAFGSSWLLNTLVSLSFGSRSLELLYLKFSKTCFLIFRGVCKINFSLQYYRVHVMVASSHNNGEISTFFISQYFGLVIIVFLL